MINTRILADSLDLVVRFLLLGEKLPLPGRDGLQAALLGLAGQPLLQVLARTLCRLLGQHLALPGRDDVARGVALWDLLGAVRGFICLIQFINVFTTAIGY